MTTWVGFLRGVNLGKRQMKMAELRASCEGAGFGSVKTILASGNVRFDAKSADEDKIRSQLEAALEKDFAFPVRVVLRSASAIEGMIASDPFAGLDPKTDAACHVMLAGAPIKPKPDAALLPAHVEMSRADAREIFLVARRLPNGRYTEGLEPFGKALPKALVITMRNWNTMLKVLA